MKNLNKFKFLLIALIGLSSFNTANAQCSASFTSMDVGSGIVSFTNTSSGNSLSYSWTFGDGSNAFTSNAQHQYTVNGGYSVCLTIFDSISQCTSTFCDSLVITGLSSPCNGTIAGFTSTDNGNGNFSFTNTSFGNYLSYYWTFGDGNTSYNANSSNNYLSNGGYAVCLTIFDSINQCTNTYCDSILVTGSGTPCNTIANFNVTDNGNGNYSFNNSSTGGSLTYYWNFGDGNSSSATNPNHAYAANGVYPVQLMAFDLLDSNCYNMSVQTIQVTTVTNPISCQAAFIVIPDSIGLGNILIINSSTGNNMSYFWNFGDGNTSTLAYPNYTYTTAGPFALCLTIDDGNSCTSTYCDSIDSGGLVLKQTGFTINVQAPIATGIGNKINLVSGLNTYPNPVKNNLNIELNLTEQTQIEVIASDITGNLVAKIVNENMNSGMNNIKWNTNNIPNGVYLLTIKSNNSIQVERIVINK